MAGYWQVACAALFFLLGTSSIALGQSLQYVPVITNYVAGVATASICSGATDAAGDGCPATQIATMTGYAVVFDKAGNMYFTDTTHETVRRVDAATGIVTVVARSVRRRRIPLEMAVRQRRLP